MGECLGQLGEPSGGAEAGFPGCSLLVCFPMLGTGSLRLCPLLSLSWAVYCWPFRRLNVQSGALPTHCEDDAQLKALCGSRIRGSHGGNRCTLKVVRSFDQQRGRPCRACVVIAPCGFHLSKKKTRANRGGLGALARGQGLLVGGGEW